MSSNDTTTIRHLRELIASIDRRVPQAHRDSERTIAEEAAALRARAHTRLAELEAAGK